jgi:hypothetical protein
MKKSTSSGLEPASNYSTACPHRYYAVKLFLFMYICDFVSTQVTPWNECFLRNWRSLSLSCNYDLLWVLNIYYLAYRIRPRVLPRPHCPSDSGYITARSHGRQMSSWHGALIVLWTRLRHTAWHLNSSFNSLSNFPLRLIYNNLLTSHHKSGNILRVNKIYKFVTVHYYEYYVFGHYPS